MLRLRPLDAHRLERVIAGRFDEAVATAITTPVLKVSGGHPGVVAALLQHLAAGAGMNLLVSYWCHANPVALTTALQDGGHEPVLWRFANLDRGDRHLLETAAVIGMSFTAADVAMALDGNIAVIPECLERLATWGIILRAETPRGAVGPVYRFWHPFHAELLAGAAGGFDILRAAANNLSRGRPGRWEFA
jgi:hypothetical protein